MKEANPEMALQLRNLPCHRRLTQLALTGHGRKGARLHHTHQDTERAQKIHRFPRKTQRSCKAKRDYRSKTRGVFQQDRRPVLRPKHYQSRPPLESSPEDSEVPDVKASRNIGQSE